jgi:hypothetical protein
LFVLEEETPMKTTRKLCGTILRVTVIIGLLIGLAPLAEAQTLAAKGKPAATKTNAQASAKPSGGPQEGIKVHGHWTIDVRNPDGTLASHAEFENALSAPLGQRVLALALNRIYVPGPWAITLGDANGAGPCDANGAAIACRITEVGQASAFVFPNLTPRLPLDNVGLLAGTLELSGTATATHPFSVARVTTEQSMCNDPGMSPSACASSGGFSGWVVFSFTAQNLQNPVNVVAGQIIQVKVVLSFS